MSRMLEEIREQPGALDFSLREDLAVVADLRTRLEKHRPRLIVLAARGTSDNAALFGRYLLEITTGIPVSLAAPSIFTLYGATLDLRGTMVVAISQSGESTDTNQVLQKARTAGAMTVGITNEPESALAGLAEFVLLVRAGREKSVAATKTYTGQLLMFYLLAYACGAPIRHDDLLRIPEHVSRALDAEGEITSRAERFTFMIRAISVARGLNYANAFEFALKLMETCYVVAERFSAADLLHGPIAMVDHAFPAFLFAPPGVTWPGMRDMILKLRGLKAETLVITDRSNVEAAADRRSSFCLPVELAEAGSSLPADIWTPIPYIVPAQIFAACLAEKKGLDPDSPRTLSKVTRTL
ncbi:MAG: SIS domain-containing protein [Bryobacteraceae bacterium]|nr:SIS domain-containing protein [Bryobacteraceae bacterium]